MGCGAAKDRPDEGESSEDEPRLTRYKSTKMSGVSVVTNGVEESAHYNGQMDVSNQQSLESSHVGQPNGNSNFQYTMQFHVDVFEKNTSCSAVDGTYLLVSGPNQRSSTLVDWWKMEVLSDGKFPAAACVAMRGNVLCFAAHNWCEVHVLPLPDVNGSHCRVSHGAPITATAVISDQQLAVGDTTGCITIFDIESMESVENVVLHRTPVRSIVEIPSKVSNVEHSSVASAAAERGVKVWEAPGGTLTHELPCPDQGCKLVVPSGVAEDAVGCVCDHHVSLHTTTSHITTGQFFSRFDSIYLCTLVSTPCLDVLFVAMKDDPANILAIGCDNMIELCTISLAQDCCQLVSSGEKLIAVGAGGALVIIDFDVSGGSCAVDLSISAPTSTPLPPQ